MRVFVEALGGHPLGPALASLASPRGRHGLASSPEEADMVLLCGSFSADPRLLTEHPVYRRFPRACAVYSGDDRYLPLAPGVYTSARRGPSSVVGRARSQAYASSYALHANEAVRAAAGVPPVAAPRPLLCSFEGSLTSRLRHRLVALPVDRAEAVIRDTSRQYRHFDHSAPSRAEGQDRYVRTLQASRFALCPRGAGTGTLRLFEAMSLGAVPVLISDAYVLPRGPAWDTFLVRVRERRVGEVLDVLRALAPDSERRGIAARAAWEEWFAPGVLFDRVVDAAAQARATPRLVEALFSSTGPLVVLSLRARLAAGRRLGGLRAGRRVRAA